MEYIVKDYETRYFAGIEMIGGFKVGTKEQDKVKDLWKDLKELYIHDIVHKSKPLNMSGLEIYRFDFMESKMVDYYALVQTDGLVEVNEDSLVTKKLPKGQYILFPLDKTNKQEGFKKVYQYIEDEELNIHIGFHVEIYKEHDLNFPENTMYLSFKLED